MTLVDISDVQLRFELRLPRKSWYMADDYHTVGFTDVAVRSTP